MKIRIVKKVNQFLHKNHFFGTTVWVILSAFIYYVAASLIPVFSLENSMLVGLVRIFVTILGGVIGGVIANIFFRKPTYKALCAVLIIWVFAIPAISFVVDLVCFDSFYRFGGMFPGLDSLGVWFRIIGGLVISVVMGVVVCIWYIVKCKKDGVTNIGVYEEGKLITKIVDVLDWIIILFGIVIITYTLVLGASEKISNWNERRIEARNEAYATQYYEVNTKYTQEELEPASYAYALTCERAATNEEEKDSLFDEIKNDLKSEDDLKAYDAVVIGADRLKALLSNYSWCRGVDMINSRVKYDYQNRTVSFWYEMELYKDQSTVGCWAVVTFDEEMNVDIRYEFD